MSGTKPRHLRTRAAYAQESTDVMDYAAIGALVQNYSDAKRGRQNLRLALVNAELLADEQACATLVAQLSASQKHILAMRASIKERGLDVL